MRSIIALLCVLPVLGGCFSSPSQSAYPMYPVSTYPVYTVTEVQTVPSMQPVQSPVAMPAQSLPPADFRPVPIGRLANYRSLKKKQTQAEFQQAYDIALSIVAPLAGLPREQQLLGIAQALRNRFATGTYSTSTKHYNDAYGYLVLGVASCAGCTRATGLCLNILGIPYEHVNENKWKHQWCRVKVNGTYWICDAFGLYAGPEPAPYAHPRGC